MVEMFDEVIEGIPVLHAAPAGKQGQPLPTIFFYHGFTSSKEVYSYFGYVFAKAGFRTILPEANLHGARFNGDSAFRLAHFWDILKSKPPHRLWDRAIIFRWHPRFSRLLRLKPPSLVSN